MGVSQDYLFEARQMQALSLAVHIPLVCFGIAFPVLVLFAEYCYLRTGDELYRVLARRWSRIMLALFAVGVVTGTILSFELGLLWPVWMQNFGNVFGLGFTLEGFSFFLEAIFIGIYAYGWDRLKPSFHFLTGIPVAVAGVAGSMFVISVNGWMNHPSGFTLRNGHAVDVHPWQALFANPMFWSEYVHMYFAAFIVCGFLLGAVYARAFLRGRRGRYERTALGITMAAASVAAPLQVIVGDWAARDVATYQPVKLAAMEGLAQTTKGAAEHLLGWYDGHAVVWGIEVPRLLSLLAFHNPNAVVKGLSIVPLADRAAGQRGPALVPDDGGDRHAARPARAGLAVPAAPAACPAPLGAGRGRGRRAAVGRGADHRLDHHRSRPPAVDRLRGDAGVSGGHRGQRHPGWLRRTRRGLRDPRRYSSSPSCGASPVSALRDQR